MLTRLSALMIVAGLGIGILLRIVLGRARFPLLVVLAHLPVAVHVGLVADTGRRAGVGTSATLIYVAAGLVFMLAGALLGRWLALRRPWLAVVVPAATAAAYLLSAGLIYNHLLARTTAQLGSLPTFGYLLATLLFTCLLLPFAPRAGAGGR